MTNALSHQVFQLRDTYFLQFGDLTVLLSEPASISGCNQSPRDPPSLSHLKVPVLHWSPGTFQPDSVDKTKLAITVLFCNLRYENNLKTFRLFVRFGKLPCFQPSRLLTARCRHGGHSHGGKRIGSRSRYSVASRRVYFSSGYYDPWIFIKICLEGFSSVSLPFNLNVKRRGPIQPFISVTVFTFRPRWSCPSLYKPCITHFSQNKNNLWTSDF